MPKQEVTGYWRTEGHKRFWDKFRAAMDQPKARLMLLLKCSHTRAHQVTTGESILDADELRLCCHEAGIDPLYVLGVKKKNGRYVAA